MFSCSSLTQTLAVSTYEWEIIFDILIIIAGLLLFAFLIGNMQVRSLLHQSGTFVLNVLMELVI
jgi:hypothetical protein